MAEKKVRARFAPSPTGQLHVGNARTALFNWLFARQQGGTMILRIEDTDLERSEARYEQQLLDDLKWMGIDWDEGPDVGGPFPPYRQSDKTSEYATMAEQLVSEGKAYYCFCKQEDLDAYREQALKEHRPPIYPGTCRGIDPAEAKRRKDAGEAAAIRLRIPERPIKFHDIVHGDVEFSNEVVSDPIILRSSGIPVYNYVVVVDDIDMRITHVIRGDDHLSNTPKQVALYEALDAAVPEFAHLSTILGPDRERLSKRHGATSIASFREMGVLPEALVNYIALLGWAPTGGTREIFKPEELVKEFDLRRVTPSPAIFDFEKLYWLNRHYIKESSPYRIAILARNYWDRMIIDHIAKRRALPKIETKHVVAWGISEEVNDWFGRVTALLVPSVNELDELPERAKLIFDYDAKEAIADPENAEVLHSKKTEDVLAAFSWRIANEAGAISAERFKAIVNEVKSETGAKGKELFHPVRIAVTGTHSGPEFDKLIPLIEEGSALALPVHVKSVKERLAEFTEAGK
ncbi:MAG TPA: glutamate--tRNA ligase [Candidatus Koribacter sp.]|jgi:glutamyl-tRNA synthetase/nondiscriminating glutamyl-tRNA synthetase